MCWYDLFSWHKLNVFQSNVNLSTEEFILKVKISTRSIILQICSMAFCFDDQWWKNFCHFSQEFQIIHLTQKLTTYLHWHLPNSSPLVHTLQSLFVSQNMGCNEYFAIQSYKLFWPYCLHCCNIYFYLNLWALVEQRVSNF